MSDQDDLLRQAHAAHGAHRFGAACEAFSAADRLAALAAVDFV